MTAQHAELRGAVAPLLAGDLPGWRGLPPASVAEFDAVFGPPEDQREEPLGAWPAVRRTYRDAQGRALMLWSREGAAVMLEAGTLPDVSQLAQLPAPDSVLPHEILLPGHYAHEYLYCRAGLVLTVAQPLREGTLHIARCRGIAPLAAVQDFGPGYYLAFEDRTSWAGTGAQP